MIADIRSDLLQKARRGDPSAQCIMGISYYNKTQLENNLELARYWLQLSAEQEYAPAQWRLADLYALEGQTTIVELYIKSALQGDTNALARIKFWKNDKSLLEKLNLSNLLILAFCYHHGLFGFKKNKKHAMLLYNKSPCSSDAQYQLGLLYQQNKQYQKALLSYEKATNDGRKPAAVKQLAFLYEYGLVSGDENLEKAIDLYTRIAKSEDQCDQAVLDAKINLAKIYRKMNSIDSAVMWYTKALETSQVEWSHQNQIAKSCLDQLTNQPQSSANSNKMTLSSRLRQTISEISDQEIQTQLTKIAKRALRKDGTAMYEISNFYDQGVYFKQNKHLSFLWMKNAAIIGKCKEAQFSLGKIIHRQGDTKLFIKWYTYAANQGHMEAQYTLGIYYSSSSPENLKAAYKWLLMAADQNHVDAYYQLGLLSLNHQQNGLGFEFDPVKYFEKAARQGHISAIYQLGLCYFEGIGGAQIDRDIGITYYEYCVGKEFPDALYALGELYYRGTYLGMNKSKAFDYFTLAANQEHADAKYKLAIMYLEKMTVEQNFEKAYLLFKDAADANHLMALSIFKTPMDFSIEHSNPKSLYDMFSHVSKEGIAKLEYNLGSICEHGCYGENKRLSIPKNIRDAVYWYSIAANQNDDVRAQLRLAALYERGGSNLERNLEASISYYIKAVDQRNSEAMYNLACIYLGKCSPTAKHVVEKQNDGIADTSKPLVSDPHSNPPSISFLNTRSPTKVEGTPLKSNEKKSVFSFPKPTASSSTSDSPSPPKDDQNISHFSFGKSATLSNFANNPPAKVHSNTSAFIFGGGGGGNRSTSGSSDRGSGHGSSSLTSTDMDNIYTVSVISSIPDYTGDYNEERQEGTNEPEYQNLKAAFYLLREASNIGYKEAVYYLTLSSNKLITEDTIHVNMLEVIAHEGNVSVQYQLGCFYETLDPLKSIEWFKMAARNNMVDACYRLALLYEKEDNVKNITSIVGLFQKAADKDHTEALYKLAEMYCCGDRVSKDFSKAFDFYEKASRQKHEASLSIVNGKSDAKRHILLYSYIAETNNNVKLQHALGSIYENSDTYQDYSEAMKWYKMAAKENYEPSLYRLGEMLEHGIGVEKDIRKAISYYIRAENQGSSRAMHSLGKIYQFGSGVEIHEHSSLIVYKMASDKMNHLAQLKYSELYENDAIMQKDVIQATRYYQKVYLQGFEEANTRLYNIYDTLSHEVEFGKKLSRLLSKIEKYGIAESEVAHDSIAGRLHFRMATLFYNGTGVQQNYANAIKSFIVSSEKYQYPLATHSLSLDYSQDSDLDKDNYLKKLEMYESAIHCLDNQRIYNIAMVYFGGIFLESAQEDKDSKLRTKDDDPPTIPEERVYVVPQNYSKALRLFSKAGENNDYESLTRIGEVYQCGLGLSKDRHKATEYHRRSANLRTDQNNYKVGLQYYKNGAYSTSIIYLNKACDQKYYPATRYVGEMYRHGLGVAKNFSNAMSFYKISFNQTAEVDYELGVEYYQGDIIEKELRIAMIYFEKAANKGHKKALKYLCSLYDSGYSLDLDIAKMKDYLKENVSVGNDESDAILDRFKRNIKKDKNVDENAIQWHKKKADNQDSLQNSKDGKEYYIDDPTKQDFSIALVYFTKAAEKGHFGAQRQLADMYYHGQGLTKNDKLAREWYIKSTSKQFAPDNCHTGKDYYFGKGVKQNYFAAFIYFQKAGQQGDGLALRYMGEMYRKGHGVDANLEIAFKYYKESSGNNSGNNNYLVGLEYYDGLVVEKDYSIALIYFKKSAEQKNHSGCTLLAKMYFFGHGVEEDQALSAHYVNKAKEYSATGTAEVKIKETAKDWFDYVSNAPKPIEWHEVFSSHQEAQENYYIGVKYYEHSFDQKFNQTLAIFYIKKAAERKNSQAQIHLADMYRNGDLLEKDDIVANMLYEEVATKMNPSENHEMGLKYFIGLNTAISFPTTYIFLIKACEQGHSASFRCIADMYNSGKGVQIDHEKAIEYYKNSAESQDANQNYLCGLVYYDYTGLENNYRIAFIYLTKSSDQGQSQAQVLLGDFYYRGLGIAQDYVKAFFHLQKAANSGNEEGRHRMITYNFHNQKLSRSEVINWNFRFANLQDREDNYTLGLKLYKGIQTAQDLELALIYFKKSAEEEHYEAQRYLGDIYYTGEVISKNVELAVSYYNMASEKQYGYYNHVLGLQYYNYGNYLGAFVFMKKAAEQGNILAMKCLGDLYYYGQGVDKNEAEGLGYHRKNTLNLDCKTNFKLAMEYYYGKNIARCYPISFVYFQNAADQGHSESQMYVIDMYLNGLGVDRDTSVASTYLRKMIHQTSSEKQEYTGFVNYTKVNIDRTSTETIEFHKTIADKQNVMENFTTGTKHHSGNSVNRPE